MGHVRSFELRFLTALPMTDADVALLLILITQRPKAIGE
jgi:hypothetical protein